ncbi:MAG: hypothetical protein K6B28_11620 [Lachnospiraceae bacterium]|nr:hypothetical protein [Lachnospiraceae bacterium]
MDILSFVNSKDIRNYLHEIDYKCDSMQAAWLVYQSYDKTYEEKHKAWQWIIDNMPDCEMPERRRCIARSSVHAYLKELMEFRDNHKKRILKGKAPKPAKKMSADEWDLYCDAFEGRWYCFPTPFKKGDIVCACYDKPHNHNYVCSGAFVLDYISNSETDMEKRSVYGDVTDMNGYGWFSDYDGAVYKEAMHNYMDLEYCTDDLAGQERILIALSNTVKGELEVDLLLLSQRVLMMRDYGIDYDMPGWYTDEGIELAGIYNLPKLSKKKIKKNMERLEKHCRMWE